MIVNENITTYLHSLGKDLPYPLDEMRVYAESEGVPIIRKEMESFMAALLEMKHPESILEIGAGIAFSTIFMAMHTREGCRITTIENYEPRLAECRKNIERDGMGGRIMLIEDDAANVLPGLAGSYDFIFLDAAKGQYITFLPELLRLMKPGSVLLADNVLQDGEIVRSRYITERRQRTIHERMREYLWEVTHCDELETSVITIGDGVTLSVRR